MAPNPFWPYWSIFVQRICCVLKDRNCTLLNFQRLVAQSLITLGKPPKVGCSISTPLNQLTANKRRKTNYLVPASIRKENVGIQWVIYDQKTWKVWGVLKEKKVESRYFLNVAHVKFTYVSTTKEIVLASTTCNLLQKWDTHKTMKTFACFRNQFFMQVCRRFMWKKNHL